ncbi:MAG: alpha-L-rhamnosidase [Saprospiraceae bacterium]|nr:alpha-L-rhamnosidase [Saprospiraceae bacterium]
MKRLGASLCMFVFLYLTNIHQLISQYDMDIVNQTWKASWVSHDELKGDEYTVLQFGKDFNLTKIPSTYPIAISADNRYKLFINGAYIGNGPARGELNNWRYDTYDIAKHLKSGQNFLRVIVWNFGQERPVFQMTSKTGLIIQDLSDQNNLLTTDSTYMVKIDESYSPIRVYLNTYFVVGPGELFDGTKHDFAWKTKPLGKVFSKVEVGNQGVPLKAISAYGQGPDRILVPRSIPFMEEYIQTFSTIRRSSMPIKGNFLKGESCTIPPRTKISFLVDQGHLTNAYPLLTISKGARAKIKLKYCESLVDSARIKGNRSEIAGKQVIGGMDVIISDGGEDRQFTSLWWRTFRYIEIEIETEAAPLTIDLFQSKFTGYPLEEKASFKSSYPLTDTIWNVAWRTQRLCAGENFFDCPYYEQLQYVGDTRIQALITRYISGDTALMRNAIVDFGDSYQAMGLTQSRYPSSEKQIIPPFSLIWIYMLDDYRTLCEDDHLLKFSLPKVAGILNWYEERLNAEGILGPMEWWNFADWVPHWQNGIPPGVKEGGSALITLQYALALQKAALLFDHLDQKAQALKYTALAKRLNEAVVKNCFDPVKGILADTPDKKSYSQQTNSMAILTKAFKTADSKKIMSIILSDTSITQATFYYSFYLFEAMHQVGSTEGLVKMLKPWEDMIEKGLTTFAEKPDPTRSDCHAWSASPIYFYLSGICGITPFDSGFKTVHIKPNLGDLTFAEGQIPHRNGMIITKFAKSEKGITGSVFLPEGLTGRLEINATMIMLRQGENNF